MGRKIKGKKWRCLTLNPILMAFAFGFSINGCLNTYDALFCLPPPFLSSPLLVASPLPIASSFSSSSLSASSTTHRAKLRRPSPLPLTRASNEANPGGLIEEDSKFVPLNFADPIYGPPAMLLLGFEVEEVAKIRQLLKWLDGEFLQVILCTEEMIPCTLWEVVHTSQQNFKAVEIAKSLPRICFLSGLSGEEMMMFIDAFAEAGFGPSVLRIFINELVQVGLEPPVFATLVPNSANKPLRELIEEIMGDHEMLTGKRQPST